MNHLYTLARISCWPPEDGSICDPKQVGANFTWTFNVFLINIELWVHELVIIETGHVDSRFKHEIWNLYAYFHELNPVLSIATQTSLKVDYSVLYTMKFSGMWLQLHMFKDISGKFLKRKNVFFNLIILFHAFMNYVYMYPITGIHDSCPIFTLILL